MTRIGQVTLGVTSADHSAPIGTYGKAALAGKVGAVSHVTGTLTTGSQLAGAIAAQSTVSGGPLVSLAVAPISSFYLHDSLPNLGPGTVAGGILPTGSFSLSTTDLIVPSSITVRSINAGKGTAQVTASLADNAWNTPQNIFTRTFCSNPIAAQTIAAQTVTLRAGLQQSNTDSNLQLMFGCLFLWRPSTGVLVSRLVDSSNSGSVAAVTTEQDFSWAVTTTAATAQDGDLLVLEVWLRPVHGSAVSYTDSLMYDGTTIGSTSSNAAYLLFTNAINMYSPGGGGGSSVGLAGSVVGLSTVTGTLTGSSGGGSLGVTRAFPGSGANTAAAFMTMMADMTLDTIQMAGGTYNSSTSSNGTSWHDMWFNIDRTARPLLVQPAPGANVIFDGDGTGTQDGMFYPGWNGAGVTAYITFDTVGTGGTFKIQNFDVGQTGIISTGFVKNFTMNNFTVRNCKATATNGWTGHTVYVASDGTNRSQHVTFNYWDCISGDGIMNNFQMEHNPQADHVTLLGWKTNGGRFGCVTRLDGTDVTIDGWTLANHISPIDNTTCVGVVRNCTSTGGGSVNLGTYTDGGNNHFS